MRTKNCIPVLSLSLSFFWKSRTFCTYFFFGPCHTMNRRSTVGREKIGRDAKDEQEKKKKRVDCNAGEQKRTKEGSET